VTGALRKSALAAHQTMAPIASCHIQLNTMKAGTELGCQTV